MDSSNKELGSSPCKHSLWIWVQCEDSNCMKWRKLMRKDDDLSEVSWYCFMNPDENYNSCNVPQEKYWLKQGETFVCSELEEGSLVWAKMCGYPSWPGIISSDPLSVEEEYDYVIYYEDGNNHPKYYHIEFLGKPPTHAWIRAHHVDLYNKSTACTDEFKGNNRRKSILSRLNKAIQNAEELVHLSNSERIKKCVFKCEEKAKNKWVLKIKDNKEQSRSNDKKKDSSKKRYSNNNDCATDDHKSENKNGVSDKACCNLKTKQSSDNVSLIPAPFSTNINQVSQSFQTLYYMNVNGTFYPVVSQHPPGFAQKINVSNLMNTQIQHGFSSVGSTNVVSTGPSVPKKRVPQKPKSKDYEDITQSYKNSKSTVKTVTKKKTDGEEKEIGNKESLYEVKADVGSDLDEDTFWDRFNKFCKRRKMKKEDIKLQWYKKDVNLFKFYQSVQYMSGFEQATSHPLIWKNLCQEVTGTKTSSDYLSLKKAYRQYLLDFEKDQTKLKSKVEKKREKSDKNKDVVPTMCNVISFDVKDINSSGTDLCSPVIPYKKKDSISHQLDHDQVVPNGSTFSFTEDIPETDFHRGLLPFDAVDSSMPNSNQQSPALSSPAASSIYDIGLDFAMEELEDLSKELKDMSDHSQELFSSQEESIFGRDSPFNSSSYFPVDSQMQDVLGELNDLEDTLVEMAGNIIGATSNLL